MRNLKRVLSLALALVMVLGMMVITTSAADFTDADEITYTEAVEVMAALGILAGDGTGNFNPNGNLNRAGAAKLIAFMTMGADADNYLTGSAASFDDVAADHWAAKYIAYCANLKIINGDGDGTFNPDGNISTVGFGKLVLGAAGIDGVYTGDGWEDNVKKALEDNGLDVVTIDTTDITREEAAALMLAGMKYTADTDGYLVKKDGTTLKKFADYADAVIYAGTLNQADPAGEGEDPKYTVVDAPATGYLLNKAYEVSFARDTDDFGRPGIRYEKTVQGKKVIDLFYADEALATFEGPVAEKDLFAAAKVTGTAKEITYACITDGEDISDWTTFDAVKAGETGADYAAPGTGFGIKSELYKDAEGNYTLIAIREYLGTVTKITDATEDAKRKVTVELSVVPAACETKTEFTFESEAFAEDDVIVVTMAGQSVKSAALAETVKGTPTKIAGEVYTIGGTEYNKSQNNNATVTLNGKEAEWYVDSFGNLIGNVGPADPVKATVYYAYLVDYARQAYNEGTGDLLTAGKVTEAAEKFKVVTAEGEALVLDGAVKVDEDDQTIFVADKFNYDPSNAGNTTKGILFGYELNDKGEISKIHRMANNKNSDVTVTKGAASLSVGTDFALTSKTVFFFVNGEGKVSAYVGYANVPSATGTVKAWNYTENNVMNAVLITGVQLKTAAPKENYVYFAGNEYTTQWDAAANEGKGGTYVLYENIYINGVKAAEGLKFADVLAQEVKAGDLYTYTVDTKTGLATLKTNVVADDATGTKVTLVQDTYFKDANGDVEYTDEDTVFWQIDTTKKTITVVESIPASTQTQNTMVLTVVDGDEAAALVVFCTAKVQG